MKFSRTVFVFSICILFLVYGCGEEKVYQENNEVKDYKDNNSFLKPYKTWVNPDSLIIRIPGKDGMKHPEKISVNIPRAVDIGDINEIVPGVSDLQQSPQDKKENNLPVKSLKPEIIKINYSKINKQSKIKRQSPIITNLPKAVTISSDSVMFFDKAAVEKDLVTIQHQDSIFPPVSLYASSSQKIKALPMSYKESAYFDIRFLDADNELPNSFIRAIAKDSSGIIWIGTHTGGVVSYDGMFFVQYSLNSGMSGDKVLALIIDRKNNIWIGTQDGGVNCFDGKKITRYTKKQGLPSNNIRAILEDSNDNIWFATTDGVSSFDGETITTFTTDQGLGNNYVTSLCEDANGNIWMGTFGGGVSKYDGKNFTTFTEEDGLTFNTVLSMAVDHQGNLWFGTYGGGVSKYNGQSFTNFSSAQGLGNDIILSIVEDSYNNMWFGTFGSGVSLFNGKAFSHYNTKRGLVDDYIRTLFDDNNGNLWIGTDGGGLSVFKLKSFTHFTTDQGLSNNLVLSIFQDNNDKLWFGTFEGGVLIYQESESPDTKGTFIHINKNTGLPYNTISSIIEDDANNFWLGTFGGGVSKLDGESLQSGVLKFNNYSIDQGLNSNFVSSALQDKKGNIWFSTDGGVTQFNGKEFTTITKNNGLGSNEVTCVYQDQNDNLWFGTINGGVSLFKDDTLYQYTTKQGLANNTVWAILQDHNGIMWFGTDGGGLSYFNGNSFRTLSTKDGLSNNYVFSLVIDDENYLWVGTTRGLNQFELPNSTSFDMRSFMNMRPAIINYGKMDGLISVDFFTDAVLYDNKNRLWWGTSKALSMLDLKNYKSPTEVPIVHIEDLIINDRVKNFGELKINGYKNTTSGIHFTDVKPFTNIPIDLSLPHNMNHLTFHFNATDWSAPHQIRYQYRMLDLDNEWSLVSKDNMADYLSIPPGQYSFQIRSIGKAENWSKTLEYSFTIRWPWWQTWWAIILYIISIGILIWLIIVWRVNIVKKQKIVLENLIFDRTRELDDARKQAEQATIDKSQFLATISHEIRTPLNAIMGLTNLAINTDLNPKQEDYLQKIDRSSVTLLSLLNDVLDFSKIEAGKMQIEEVNFDLEIVLNSIIVLNLQTARDKKLEFVVSIDPLVPRMLIGDPLRIGQIITNLCSNAIKFTSSGEVVIHVSIGKKIGNKELLLEISVLDTGIGISEEQIPFLFEEFKQADSSITRKYGGTGLGLTICKLLVEMMDGEIWIETELGKGTTFFFNCKVGVQHDKHSQTKIIPDELKGNNLLVCIDQPATLISLITTLQSFSLNVDKVTSGEEVLKQLETKSYDLLLIDNQIGDMSGVETIISAHKNTKIPPIKTILITDDDKYTTSFEKNTLGIDEYLIKPFLPSVVLEKIMTVFGMEKVSSSLHNEKDLYVNKIKKAISGKQILLAEDNEINSQVVSELINIVGIKVDLANNGAKALQLALKVPYDLILMDLHMPVMDGYDSSRQIRKNNILTPIIAITAEAISLVEAKCKEARINDIITKPINPDLLYDKLLKWMDVDIKPAKLKSKPKANTDKQLPSSSFPNLDMQTAVRRFGGNEKLYKKMLDKFVYSNKQTCANITELISKGEFEKAHILIHTLKGESGNVGATKVFKLSQQIEKAVSNKNVSEIEKKVILLEKSITEITVSLQNYFQATASSIESSDRSIKEVVQELIKCLKLKNPKAFDLLDELTKFDFDRSEIDAINNAVSNDDLDKAFDLLEKLSDS